MPENKMTEMQRLEILRLSNAESNRITKACIESALTILMKDKCFHDISITDIVRRAGVSRTAYYRNYKSKEDILRNMIREIVDQVMVEMVLHPPIKNTLESWYYLFHTVKQHADFFHILLRANLGDIALEEIHKKVLMQVRGSHVQETYKSYFWIGAIYNVSAAWIRDGMPQSVEEIAKICYNIIKDIDGNCTAAHRE